jgi:hypothetical protein
MFNGSVEKVNIISFVNWKQMKKEKGQCILQMKTTACKLFPYGAHSALDVVGEFNVDVTVSMGLSSKTEEFLVFNIGVLLLGKNTTKRVCVLKVRLHINQISVSEMKTEFPTVFKGLGKPKGFHLRKTPVVQHRRVKFHLRVSLVHLVTKKPKGWRLVLYMKIAFGNTQRGLSNTYNRRDIVGS